MKRAKLSLMLREATPEEEAGMTAALQAAAREMKIAAARAWLKKLAIERTTIGETSRSRCSTTGVAG